MCGGFVLGQVADRMARLPATQLCEWRRLGTGALGPYHLGRLTTYAGLGTLAGLGGAAAGRLVWFGWLSGLLLLLAAGIFLAHAVRRLARPGHTNVRGPRSVLRHSGKRDDPAARRVQAFAWMQKDAAGITHRAHAAWAHCVTRITRNIDRTHWRGGYALGVALGFLPCGFLYAALAAAASSGSAILGAAGMLAFGLGTAPALIVLGVAGQAAGQHWQRAIAAGAPIIMVLNAGLLVALAVRHLAVNV
jgi:sulfite exporter TauE/SafE